MSRRGRLRLALLAAALIGVAGGFAFHRIVAPTARPPHSPSLPRLHGQAVWAAGSRPAPQIGLRDERGQRVSLRALRSHPVLLTFMDSRCKAECPIQGRQLAAILRRLPRASRPTLVIVGVNPAGDTPASIDVAVHKWGLDGAWSWHWLRGTPSQLAKVWRAYGVTVEPASGDIVHSLALYLIDRAGFERTAYLFPFLPAFVQRDLATLAQEAPA